MHTISALDCSIRSFIRECRCGHCRTDIGVLLEYCLWHHQLSLLFGRRMFHDNSEKDLQSTEEEEGSGCLAGNIEIFVVSVVVLHAAFISYSVLPRVEEEDIAEE